MANTTAVYARIDSDLKENAEKILLQLGISPSGAIQMLYSQIVLQRGMPFDLRLPPKAPTAIGALTDEQLDEELLKGLKSLNTGKAYTEEEAEEELRKRFGL